MGTNIGENISKNLRGRYSQKLLDHTKQTAALKTVSKRAIQKNSRSWTGGLMGNKMPDRIMKVSKASM